MYRVYQAYDNVVKQDSARTAQAAMRNAFTQRSLKPTFKSAARINKDAGSKAKRVIKEARISYDPYLGLELTCVWRRC